VNRKVEITIRISTEAQSRSDTPYLEHDQFVKYCRANKIYTSEQLLESYEKNKLLYPCIRVLYPRELLRRYFRASHSNNTNYKIRDEWKPLIELESFMNKCDWMYKKEFNAAINYGHPLEQALKKGNAFVLEPMIQNYKAWDKYRVIVGKYSDSNIMESRAEHYYSPWKIFIIDDLKALNTYKRHMQSSLGEFISFFKVMCSFIYRRSLLIRDHRANPKKPDNNWQIAVRKSKQLAKNLFTAYSYMEWIHFLRKLIELHEQYIKRERLLLSFEAKSYIARMIIFLRFATDKDFEMICNDVTGKFKGSSFIGASNGISIYPGKLEELFSDEKWDLEHNAKWLLQRGLKVFNSSLISSDTIPESLADELFNDLAEEPSGTALAAIRKINKAYFDMKLWRDNETWSGVRDLAVSIEEHGREWLGGKSLDGVYRKLFGSEYNELKRKSGQINADARSAKEFLNKLEYFQATTNIPINKRCGRHLLITYLIRNYSTHRKGLSGEALRMNIDIIYSSLVNTLLTIYAKYKGA
jgi:hypothetical protein